MLANGKEPAGAATAEAEKAAIDAVNIEEAELQAYMDPDNYGDEGPDEAFRIAYFQRRYEETREEYKRLCCEREEIDGMKKPELDATLNKAFKKNYQSRKYFVWKLKTFGNPVKDKFVPDSE